jgi:hypothetical protein
VQLLLEELLLLHVRGWSESGYSSSPTIPHASSCSSLFVLHLLGVFFPAYEKMLQWGASCRRRKSSHCWSPTQYWPSCCAPNTPGRSRGGGQLLSLELQLRTAMCCCCCAYCSSQCTAAGGHTVAAVCCYSHSPLRGMAGSRRDVASTNVHSTLTNVHSTLTNVHSTLTNVHSTLTNVHSTLTNVHSTLTNVHSTLTNVHSTYLSTRKNRSQ